MTFIKRASDFLRGSGEREHKTAFWLVNAGAMLLWSAALGLVGLYFASAAINHWSALFISYLHSPALMALNILPCLMLTALFYLLTNRVWGAVCGSGLVVISGSLVNFYKITLRNDPLLAADMALVSEAANITGQYTIKLNTAVVLTILVFLAACIFSACFLKAKLKNSRVRVAALLMALAVCGLTVNGLYFSDSIYTSTENIERNLWFMSRWSDRDQYVSRGFLYPFIHSVKNAAAHPPEGYDQQDSLALLQSYQDEDIPDGKKVSVIAIMLEAYNDFSAYGTLDFDADPYEYFHKLKEGSLSGRLVTNIFAGGTIDTERAFITGYSNMSEYRSSTPSYAGYFASQGYNVEGGHPGYDWFYNRRNVNDYFGFENYYFFEDRYATTGDELMMDDEFFEDILGLYEQSKESGRPYFNFSVTYQNHGPYSDSRLYDGQTVYVRDKGYSAEAYRILNNYFWGIKKTDQAIESLIETLRRDDDPVVVVLFGDHQPWLGDNSYVYDEIGVSLDRGSQEGFYNYYCTPYVIWANDSAKAVTGGNFSGDGGDFSPCFLMNRLFDECRYGGNAFMKASRELYEYVDVINKSGIFRERGGELTTQLKGEALERYNAFSKLEYYMKKDY